MNLLSCDSYAVLKRKRMFMVEGRRVKQTQNAETNDKLVPPGWAVLLKVIFSMRMTSKVRVRVII